ncbi:MAG: D-alanine--D-alanine ligase [Deltaproteobacteria bacterium]|nr:D-alanine--D-alanine ligase [Deltaproteobacteria bacterium]
MEKTNIAVLAGGWSGEREISIKSGEAVYNALDKEKYNVTRYDPRDDLASLIKEMDGIDLAFILLHGKFGEDGCVQGFLDLLGVPFVGSGVLTSAMTLNKRITKEIYKGAGLNVVKDVMLNKDRKFAVDNIIQALGPSTVVKPVAEGSSLGISLCHNEKDLLKGINLAFQYDQEVMVEQYIKGREITCCVIGEGQIEALPLVEIVPNQGYAFFDYEAKYTPGATKEICPAPISDALSEKARYCAKQAHQILRCKVWSRTDMIIQDNKIYLLETNTIPGMTKTSLFPLAAKAAGMTLSQLLDRLIELSLDQRGSD